MSIKGIFFLMLTFAAYQVSYAQSCCSGGVPMSGNLGLPVSDKGSWQFSASYDLNVLNTLKDGRNTLADNTRKRTTHSILTEVGYTLNDRFSFDAFFSFVRQERKLNPIGQNENFDATTGLGDAVFLVKYRFYKKFQVGLGVKAPLGASDKQNNQGLTLNADLQPGSGAWDLIYWLSGSQPLGFRKSMSLSTTIIYRSTGQNNSYFNNQVYEFGNEFQGLVGVADKARIDRFVVDYSVSLKYRKVTADNNDDFDVPSTGGQWVFIRPGLGFGANQYLTFQTNIELPVFAELQGTQVTPSYRLNVGFLFLLPSKKNKDDKLIKVE